MSRGGQDRPSLPNMKKSLRQQLAEAIIEKNAVERRQDYYIHEATEAKEELKKLQGQRWQWSEQERTELAKLSTQQFEIIRWLVNPETAKDPFNEAKRHETNTRPFNL
jgi:hypothetical protein